MTNKTSQPGKPYVYAFSSARLVLLACVVLALMALSLMLGIRIERYQRASEVVAFERLPRAPVQAPSEPAGAPSETETPVAEPQKATPAQAEKPAAQKVVSPKQPPPAPPEPEEARAAEPPKPEEAKAAEPPKPEETKVAEPPKPEPSVSTPKVEPRKQVPPPEKKEVPKGHYAIQVSSSQDKAMAISQAQVLKRKAFPAYIEAINLGAKGRWFRVMIGPFRTKAEAEKVLSRLAEDSSFAGSYVRYLP
ncbi:MAG: SPOR domain-containing protein [Candidatus Hydrogenedentota bacterium]|nr:MAG: SPOR domain-containing protein [Candidatus Hydrogenedentota bacterium]